MRVLIRILTTLNICVSFVVWMPAWLKIARTRCSKDYSMLSLLMILFLQVSNLTIALSEHAKNVSVYMATNTLIVLATCIVVRHFQRESKKK